VLLLVSETPPLAPIRLLSVL